MIRKFRLTNGAGDGWDLNSRSSFFHSIAGLGFKDGTQYEQVGTDFIPLEELFSQGEMSGRILFGGSTAYQTYRAFSRFVRAVPLTLIYQTDEIYRVPVRLTELSKGELMEGGGGLVCDVTFLATGLFYKSVTRQSGVLSIGGKVYPYTYSYSYAEVSQNTLVIDSDSYEDSPCKVTIFGPCLNPVWKHYVDNVLVETGRYEGLIMADHKLVVDATGIPYSITERGAADDIVADRYQLCDFTTERFFHLKHGSNRISVSHDGLNTVKMMVEGKGCNVTYARGNVLHVSQGFGMIKGRFFEVYDCEVGVILNSGSGTLQGRLYIHMDLSNADEPIQLLTETASVLTDLTGDEDVNFNNTAYDLELATFGVTRTGITSLVTTFEKITGASGSGGASSLQRSTEYFKGDFVTCKNAPGWVTLYCTTAGTTAAAEPVEYAGIAQVGDRVTDGTCVFTARDVVGEIDVLKDLFTDTEASIAGLEDGLQELREELNHKAENLPPPVGTIKYSAADPGPDWVKCDGSFVSEDDYPELLPLLNQKEPTATDLLTAYTAEKAGAITNTCVFNGSIWVYLVDAHLLVGIPPTSTAKTIPVSGAETLSSASPAYLSICGGALYLTQIGGTQTKILLFELVSFTGSESSIEMAAVTTYRSGSVTQTATQFTIPYVVDVGGMKMMSLCINDTYLYYVTWKAGEYSTTSQQQQVYCTAYSSSMTKEYSSKLAAKFGFSVKNQNEALYASRYMGVYINGSNYGFKFWFSIASVSQSLYGTPQSDPYHSYNSYAGQDKAIEQDERGKYLKKLIAEDYTPQMITLPAGANNEYLYNVDLVDRKVTLMHGRYNGGTLPEWRELNIKLPSRAVLFTDSVCYVAEQSMWFIFVGTGLLFGSKLATSGWGYIDTMGLLGLVAKYGCITYLPGENALYISGLNTAGVPVVCKLLFDGTMDFTGAGAWLPVLTKDGIPAYIKAKTTE